MDTQLEVDDYSCSTIESDGSIYSMPEVERSMFDVSDLFSPSTPWNPRPLGLFYFLAKDYKNVVMSTPIYKFSERLPGNRRICHFS